MTAPARHPHHPRGQRLLALLLAVLLAMTSLSGHAAMGACADDCAVPQAERPAGGDLGSGDLDCGACAALPAAPVMRVLPTASPVDAAHPALVDRARLPARPPPRP